MKKIAWALAAVLIWASCGSETETNNQQTQKKLVEVPTFSGDSAYAYVDAQVAFGPRVPNTKGHQECAQYLVNKLESFGAKVMVQEAVLTAFDGTKLQAKNIIAAFRPEIKNRVALMAHWDTRPFADMEEDPEKQRQPILGANDGGSGVGVLLEVARQLGKKSTNIGIDIILFDAEDYGTPRWIESSGIESWCLGSQYWARNPHIKGYYAQYGILLDMVGAPGAVFTREALSMHVGADIIEKVWNTAHSLGYSDFFSYDKTPQIIDDHTFVNKIANIPTIDIIQHDPTTEAFFGKYWHTHNDNMDVIDKQTLKAVGQTLLHVIYNE